MVYNMESGNIPELIDRYRTGNYGEDSYMQNIRCTNCDKQIAMGERYFDVGGSVYCMDCADAADEHILESVRDEYIYEV